MYTALFVDDEKSVSESLISGVSWNDFGVSNLLTASDGESALVEMAKHPVDLLITDIKMPRMDGMELLKKVRADYPDTRCILLTAYGEFQYARQAIRLGVENYLLKPLDQNELENTIEKALDNLYLCRQNNPDLFRENILLRWVKGAIGSEELAERAGLLHINTFQSCYCAICLRKFKNCSSAAFRNVFRELCSPDLEIHSFWDDANRYVLILGGAELPADALRRNAVLTLEKLHIKDSLAVAIGPVVFGSENLPESYKGACILSDTSDLSVRENPVMAQPGRDAISCGLPGEKLFDIPRMTDPGEREEFYGRLSPIVRLAVDYIHKHYSENISIKDFCVKTKMNAAYLGFLFKNETGIFFSNYLMQYRLFCAVRLLRDTEKQIREIASEVGFSSTSYFISCFKKQTGLSPSKFRNSNADL